MPATNEKALAKARALAADIVIVDLEDAVPPDAKVAARQMAVEAVQAGGFGEREVLIRANGRETPWGAGDVAAIAQSGADGLLVPKVTGPTDIGWYHTALRAAPAGMALWVMIETCTAVQAMAAIATMASDTRLAGFVMGTNDLGKEMRARVTPDRIAFLPILTMAITFARGNGLVVLDGVCNDFNDPDQFADECRQGLVLGFDGKTIIHPKQVEPCNAVFSPSPKEIAWAERIVSTFAEPGNVERGVLQVDGKMVELLHLEDARSVLASAAAISRRGAA